MELFEIYKNVDKYLDKEVVLSGWIRNHRRQKDFGFIDFADGSHFNTIQIVYDNSLNNFEKISKLLVGCSLEITGKLIKSTGNQDYEIKASNIKLLGNSDESYPIQPKRHTREFLREVAYLRPRTNLFQAVFRIRSLASLAIHEYFGKNNYVYVHTPLLTCADCEGSGEMFKVTTLDFDNLPKTNDGKIDFKKDLFGKQTYITGSGQLHGETFAMAFRKIYTFGPTFRSENSNTKTHANEFWMIEPEIAFCDLEELMNIEEDMLKYIVNYILINAKSELEFLNKFVDNTLIDRLTKLVNSNFVRIDHKDVVDILNKSGKEWEFKPDFESDIQKEHERYITEYFNGPVFIKNWPKDIKSFYMKLNDDKKTVAAVDLEIPGIGELMGGSQREDDYDLLVKRLDELKLDKEGINWYLNLRKYGGCIHSGFGMGFERLIMYLTGIDNIRDVIPYPRTPNNCEY